MGKVVTSKKRKKLKAKYLTVRTPFSSKELKDRNLVVETLLDCIRIGDIDSFREVLFAHLMTVNKTNFAKKSGLGRRTLYALIDNKKEFNPELSTLTAIFQSIAA